ncbi:MAG TPA: aldehyde dehydrogenase [Chitinophagaceae bacterium]|nr:aldehyde dehydrogenase [Chitinophagaceae bacterium]
MDNDNLLPSLFAARNYFNSGVTRSYESRKAQLQKLKQVILANEDAINQALYQDLKKSPEEAYASELGLLLAEINVTLKNLRQWMQPVNAGTDLVNLPSSSKIYRDPLGVVLIISPWNYPLQLLLIPLVGAIAGGNCAIIKPSELAPATATIIEKIITEVFPPEFVKVVQGDGARVIPEMMNAFRFDHVFYTGSIPVGKIIYQLAAKDLVPVTLELGGKSPAIVEAGASLSCAARRIVLGKFLNVGQTCIAPDYLLVHASVKNELVEKMKRCIQQFYGADAASSYDYGKIINERRFNKLVSYLDQGDIICGGQHDKSKLFIAPTLIENVSLDAPLMTEEIFGPLLPVFSFTTTEEAMQVVNRNANPLAFYLFTSSKNKEREWINAVSFGGGCINNADWHFTNHHLPFGGVGNSGMGAYHGKFTFNTFTRQKPVLKTPTWFDPAIKYPSFKGKLRLFKWIIR